MRSFSLPVSIIQGAGERRLIMLGPVVPIAAALVLWGVALLGVDLSRMGDFGLVPLLPPAFYAALAILIVSFCLTVRRRDADARVVLVHLILFIFIIHGTPHIVYGTLRYSWAWKHVAIVNYIQAHHAVDPYLSVLGVYHNWPGFFALNALIVEATGLDSAASYAGWAPVFFNLLNIGPLLFIFKACTRDRRLAWFAVWLFCLTNWVGQDYFSPQALAYFFYLVILGLCLNWLNPTGFPDGLRRLLLSAARLMRRLPLRMRSAADRMADVLWRNAITPRFSDDTRTTVTQPYRIAAIAIVAVLLFAIVSSHQLTPFMVISALVFLVAARQCSARGLPALAFVLTFAWIAFMAAGFITTRQEWILRSISFLISNVDENLVDLARVSDSHRIVASIGRLLTLGVFGLAGLGWMRRLREGYFDLPAMLMAASPLLILTANSYGGEMVFRFYLFALPFLSFFGASLIYAASNLGESWKAGFSSILLSGALLSGFFFAYYGKEHMYYFTPHEVQTAQLVFEIAPDGALILDGTTNWPLNTKHYERYHYVSLQYLDREDEEALYARPLDELAHIMSKKPERTSAAYFIITRSQKMDNDTTGPLRHGSLARFEAMMLQSSRFRLVYANPDAKIFALRHGN
jgi:hypothetical protein